jgi:hypothetical protein
MGTESNLRCIDSPEGLQRWMSREGVSSGGREMMQQLEIVHR